jgi:cold shock CspA family protein
MRASTSSTQVASSKPAPPKKQTKGRIKTLTRGQACGTIHGPIGDVFFHKADFQGKFWDLNVGDMVMFDLLNDTISGPRAQNVKLASARKAR